MRNLRRKKDQSIDELKKASKRIVQLEALLEENNKVIERLRESEKNYRNLTEIAYDAIFISETDITKEKLSRDRLLDRERKFKRLSQEFNTLLDAIPDRLILLSPDLKILWSNKAFDSKIGIKSPDSVGKNCYRICCNISSYCKNCPAIRCFQSGKEESNQVIDADGRVLLKRAFPIFDDFGVCNVIELSQDITAQIRIEEEMKLVQTRLIHANKMTSLGTLVASVAHEVNNPNSYIMSNAQVLAKIWEDVIEILKNNYDDNNDLHIGGVPFPKLLDLTPKLLGGIKDGSTRINNIVENLKNFARSDSKGLEGKVNLNTVIMSSRSILDNLIKKYTQNFNVSFNENLPIVKGSAQQIEQVIINLIINALQSLPDKRSGVWISTYDNKKSNNVEIKVRDEGVGMSEDLLHKITEPFFTTKFDTGGTGLGLSISYTIIRDHGGVMSFESEEGKGTTVTVTLPA